MGLDVKTFLVAFYVISFVAGLVHLLALGGVW